MTAKKFKNFSAEDFSWKFDGVDYSFKAGQELYLEADKAEHFAKHLVDREMNRLNVERSLAGTKDEISTASKVERNKLLELCFPTEETVTPIEALNLNEKAKKGKKKVETEFEDLNK